MAREERELREKLLYEGTDIDPVGPPETHDIEYDPRKDAPAPTPPPKGTKVDREWPGDESGREGREAAAPEIVPGPGG